MCRRITGSRTVLALVAVTALFGAAPGAAQADEPTASARAGVAAGESGEALATRFNELSGAASGGGSSGSGSSSGSITPPASGTLGVQASSQRVTRRRAVVTRLRLARTRRAVVATIRCPAQVARSCQVAARARIRARTASATRRITIRSGSSRTITLRFTRAGRRALRRGGRLSARVTTRFGALTLTSARAVSVRRARR